MGSYSNMASKDNLLKDHPNDDDDDDNDDTIIKPEKPRWRILKTICIVLSSSSSGMNLALIGSTLPELAIQTSSTTEQLSFVITTSFLGRMVGSALYIAISDKLSPVLHLTIFAIGQGLSMGLIPWCHEFISLGISTGLAGLCVGSLGTCAASNIFLLWKHNGGPVLITRQLSFTMFCAVSPLIAQSFVSSHVNNQDAVNGSSHTNGRSLTQRNVMHGHNESVGTVSELNYNPCLNVTYECPSNKNDAIHFGDTFFSSMNLHRGTAVPFSISAAIQVSIGLLVYVVYLSISCKEKSTKSYKSANQKQPKRQLLLLSLLLMFTFLSSGLDLIFSLLLSLYLRQVLLWTPDDAAYAATTYFMALAAGRVSGIPITKWISPEKYLAVSVILTYCSITALYVVGNPPPVLVWGSFIATAMSLAVHTPGACSLGNKHMHSNATPSYVVFSRYISGLIIPTLAGYCISELILIIWITVTLLVIMYVSVWTIVTIPNTMHNKIDKLSL